MTTVRQVPWALTHACGRLVIACRRQRIASDAWRGLERALDDGHEAHDPARFFGIVADCLGALAQVRLLPSEVATAVDRVQAALP